MNEIAKIEDYQDIFQSSEHSHNVGLREKFQIDIVVEEIKIIENDLHSFIRKQMKRRQEKRREKKRRY